MANKYGGFAAGLASSLDAKAIGGAINSGITSSKLEDAENAKKESLSAIDAEEKEAKGKEGYDASSFKQRRDDAEKTYQDSAKNTLEFWKGTGSYDKWRNEKNEADLNQIKADNARVKQALNEKYAGNNWIDDKTINALNSMSGLVSPISGVKYGTFKMENGRVFNDTGKGFIDITDNQNAIGMLKNAALGWEYATQTGDYAGVKDVLGVIGQAQTAELAREKNAIDKAKVAQADEHFKTSHSLKEREFTESKRKTDAEVELNKGKANYYKALAETKDKIPIAKMKPEEMKVFLEQGWIMEEDSTGQIHLIPPEVKGNSNAPKSALNTGYKGTQIPYLEK